MFKYNVVNIIFGFFQEVLDIRSVDYRHCASFLVTISDGILNIKEELFMFISYFKPIKFGELKAFIFP